MFGFSKGDRVRTVVTLHRYPHFRLEEGATGTVVEDGPECFSVRLDLPVEGAEEWENEIHWYPQNGDDATGDLEMLRPKVGERVAAVYPNESWGTGLVTDVDDDRRVQDVTGRMVKGKPVVVRRDSDRAQGHFHYNQVGVIPTVEWDSTHADECPVTKARADLLADIAKTAAGELMVPKSYLRHSLDTLRGAFIEYRRGGDQEAETCLCGAVDLRCAICGDDLTTRDRTTGNPTRCAKCESPDVSNEPRGKDADLFERYVVDHLTTLFVFAESHGYCFDVLVRNAIEAGERRGQ